MNQMGANIQYPYHELPMITTDDRLGFWALFGIYEDMIDDISGESGNAPKVKKVIDSGRRREDEK